MLKELERVEAAFFSAYTTLHFREDYLGKAQSINDIMMLMCADDLFPRPNSRFFDPSPTKLRNKVFAMLERIAENGIRVDNYVYEFTRFLNHDIANNNYIRLKSCLADVLLKGLELQSGIDLGWKDAKGIQVGKPTVVGLQLCGIAFHGLPALPISCGRHLQEMGLDRVYFSYEASRGFGCHYYQIGGTKPWYLFGRTYEWFIDR